MSTATDTTPAPYVPRSIQRDMTGTTIVYPLVGEYLLVDQGDSRGCVEYSGEVEAVNGSTVTIGGIEEDLDMVAYWAVLIED